jgi:Dihydrofolate reductase
MRKIIVSNYVTVDGLFAGPRGEIDWFVWDKDMEDYSRGLLRSIDTILFGRVTYELMAAYWPVATEEDPIIKERMNALPKIVFSRSLEKADWNNTRLVREIDGEEIRSMKSLPGKDMVIIGSGTIVQSLTNLGLIDEYRLIVNPVVLGNGKPLFQRVKERVPLKLEGTQTFRNGVVLLIYRSLRNMASESGQEI